MLSYKSWTLALILLWIMAGSLFVHFRWRTEEGALERLFVHERRHHARAMTQDVSRPLEELYEGLRTVARLMGVRQTAGENVALSEEARRTIREIYANLRDYLALSEIYVVPIDFDPERIDPLTGEPEEPLASFD